MNIYYTYAYLRIDGTPYYIGKGKKHRAYDRKKHTAFVPPRDRILFLKQNLTEEEAFKHEKYMISVFGRKDLGTGILYNKSDGGNGCSGYIHTEERKELIRQKQLQRWSSEEERNKIRGKNNHFYGKKHSEETKQKIIEHHKQYFAGSNNPNSKTWKLTYENGKVCMINCLKDWCRKNGYRYGNIINVHRGQSKNHKGIVSVEKI